eukprot:TRINITY_DN13643_c0_g1_i1.p1 TRINITY_DN13643_c0_g1~~TRINITY_DN13643_c0_g1_i1.p1  ORF type:complete len:276 (-),score=40.22 TRINITY_DN13643_c0_g1_i1:124-951(-)
MTRRLNTQLPATPENDSRKRIISPGHDDEHEDENDEEEEEDYSTNMNGPPSYSSSSSHLSPTLSPSYPFHAYAHPSPVTPSPLHLDHPKHTERQQEDSSITSPTSSAPIGSSDTPHMLILTPPSSSGVVHTAVPFHGHQDVPICTGLPDGDCLICTRDLPSRLQKKNHVIWSDILRICLYCLRYDASSDSLLDGYASLKHEIYPFLTNHWKVLCKGKSPDPRLWHKQIQDALSHRPNYFESGTRVFNHYGYWKLHPGVASSPWIEESTRKKRTTT